MNKFYIYKNIYKNINAVLDDLLLFKYAHHALLSVDGNNSNIYEN